MAVKVTLPNVKQPITDASGYITKAHYDFLRSLWNRTGGNNDNINDVETDINSMQLFTFRTRVSELEKRLNDLDKEITSHTAFRSRIGDLEKRINDLEKELASI